LINGPSGFFWGLGYPMRREGPVRRETGTETRPPCRVCGRPMTLVDEATGKWYCYQDDEVLVTKSPSYKEKSYFTGAIMNLILLLGPYYATDRLVTALYPVSACVYAVLYMTRSVQPAIIFVPATVAMFAVWILSWVHTFYSIYTYNEGA
jgi:hypothetical protein